MKNIYKFILAIITVFLISILLIFCINKPEIFNHTTHNNSELNSSNNTSSTNIESTNTDNSNDVNMTNTEDNNLQNVTDLNNTENQSTSDDSVQNLDTPSTNTTENVDKNSVTYNGWLHTSNTILVNEKGETVQLRGVSSHGIEWFSNLITYENLKTLKNDWNTNIFRIAMYTDSNNTGYIFSQDQTKQKVCNIIDMAIDLDMYVIIDWHILSDNNPQKYKEQSKAFFDYISNKYSNNPNVIYEICNEPNGADVTWLKDIKPYAEEVIPIIRKNSEKSLIIVGTADWSKGIADCVSAPLNFDNVVYTLHFYSGSHKQELRDKIDYCLNNNIPVFVSECGLTDASGDGARYFDEFTAWINYLNDKKISWLYWSLSNKNEGSAILLPEYNPSENINNYLTDSGKFIRDIFINSK